MNKTTAYAITAIVVIAFGIFFLYPVGVTLAVAFKAEGGGLTLDYILGVFANPVYLEGLWNALLMGVFSTVGALLIALPLALAAHRWEFPGKKLLSILILAPLVLPPFVGALGIKHIFGASGAFNAFFTNLGLMSAAQPVDWLVATGLLGVVIMNALHLYPILYLNISSALSNLDPAIEQAAQNMGCPPWRRLWKITLPLCVPSIFVGATIVFIWSFTELGVPLVFDYTRVASVQVYDGIKDLNASPIPYALVGVMLVISASVFLLSKKFLGRFETSVVSHPMTHCGAEKLETWRGRALTAGFSVILFIACLPHLGVLFLSFSGDWYASVFPDSLTMAHYDAALGHPLVVPSIKNSLIYASWSTVLAIIFGAAIAWLLVRSTIRGKALLDTLVMLPLAVPGLVLALGYIAITQKGAPLHWMMGADNSPIFLLIAAYTMRRLPYIVRAAVAGFEQSNITLEEAAQTLGAVPKNILKRVTIPLIGTNLVAGGILVFAFAVLEVSDSLILAQQADHYPVTKAIYSLLSTLGNGHELASVLGIWAMIFLGVSILGAFVVLGKKVGGILRM